jgi:general secretion pathway protein F
LIALNDEIAALVRAGVPLERGLVDIGADIPGALGDVMQRMGTRMGAGETLPQALAAEGASLPSIYRAVVEAGVRSGRLAAALEGMGLFARGYTDMRRAVGLALFYPLLVFSLAYALFVLFVTKIAPRFVAEFEHARVTMFGAVSLLNWLGQTAVYWGPAVPAVLLLVGLVWLASGRAAVLEPGRIDRLVRFVPWARGVLVASRSAGFADVLALLVEHGVPLAEAVGLAANASGDKEFIAAGRQITGAIERGDPLHGTFGPAYIVPPVLRWLMIAGHEQAALISALRHAAETYRRRALNQADMARTVLPTLSLIAIGAVVTLFYGLTLFIPMTALLSNLSQD